MSGIITKTALVILLLGVTVAQVYEDQKDDIYDYASEGEETDLVDVEFSQEKFTEFITCLCMGLSKECIAHYTVEESTLNIVQIEKDDTFTKKNPLCKYYTCSHIAESQQIVCTQAEQKSAACESATVAQFFQHQTHECCGLTCVGLFWANLGEHLILKQNLTDIVPCDDHCLCPTDGQGAYIMTKIPQSSLTSSTEIGTYFINKTSVLKSLPTSPSLQISEAVATEEDVVNSVFFDERKTSTVIQIETSDITTKSISFADSNGTSWKSPSSGNKNDERSKIITIIIIIAIAVALISIVVVTVICIRRQQKCVGRVTLNATAESSRPGHVYSSHREDLQTSPKFYSVHRKNVETSPKFYSRLSPQNTFTSGKNGYEHSHKLSNSGVPYSDSNNHDLEAISHMTEPSVDSRSIVNSSKIQRDSESSQPLLTFPKIKESVV